MERVTVEVKAFYYTGPQALPFHYRTNKQKPSRLIAIESRSLKRPPCLSQYD